MQKPLYLKYGGVKFVPLADAGEINNFVARLPEKKRQSLHQVAQELWRAGLISIPNDGQFATIDEEMEPYLT